MTTIFYFGGAQATEDEVLAWKRSVLEQVPGPMLIRTQVFVYPWPKSVSAVHPVVPSFALDVLVATVLSVDDDKIYIVGHSSGCYFSNLVAQLLFHNYPHKKFHLICLDGFLPSADVLSLPETQVWTAKYGDYKSLNYDAMSHVKNFHVYTPKHEITGTWGLHFSLVNTNANSSTVIHTGYVNCEANLSFLV